MSIDPNAPISQPNAPAAAPSAPPDAPTISTPAPDLSALAAPGPNAQPSLEGTQEFQGYQTAVGNEAAATKKASDIANTPTPAPYAGPHARLMEMVQGLATGLSAAGTALATHGREGGAPEVAQIEGERQQQKLQAQQAAQAQKNNAVQQQLTIGETNRSLAQSYLNLMTVPEEMEARHVALQGAQLDLTGKQQGQAITGADFQASHGGMKPEEYSAAMSSDAPAVGGQGVNPFFVTNAKQTADAATKVLGANDPFVQNLQSILANPKATPRDLVTATSQLENQQARQSKATDEQIKLESAQAAARPKDLNDATGRLTQAQQAYKASPNPDTKAALDVARTAQSTFMDADRQQKQIAQDLQNGDPEVIGAALADGVYAPSQVLSARSMSKPFYSKVVAAANDHAKQNGAPEIVGPNGQHTGQYFNAATAESQFKYSTNVQTQNTLNKILTLNEPGGDLDILKDAASALPKMDSKTLNKIFNAGATEFGSPEATRYHQALYNFAGLLAQVQTGGIPTEGEIQQQLNLMSAANSKGQLDAAIQTNRQDIAARGRSMVSNNPYLRYAYPSLTQSATPAAVAAPAGSPASKVHANLGDFTHQFSGAKGTIYSDDGSTWFDANGNVVKGK